MQHRSCLISTFCQEKKIATKQKISQMEAELAAASEEMKHQKEQELSKKSSVIK